jgi:GntR family transcriptional regulator/MocR family aminotransferase
MVGPESERLLGYGFALGFPPLRRAIADYVTVARGVACDESQVIVTAGAQQALDLIGRVLLEPGDAVLLEEPGYFGAREAFAAAGARITAVPVDEQGMDVAVGEALSPHARLACVSPSHQFPLGVTMSVQRRLALLEWATRTGAWIVEDDYDGEFRYVDRPLASLQGLEAERNGSTSAAHSGRVLYVGTFSKTLYPSLRLGYVIVPTPLLGAFADAKAATDRHTATVDQAVLADFITEGHYARHVRRMRLAYAARQATLVAAAATHLARWLEVRPSDAGMHLVGWMRESLPREITDQALSKAALEHGVVAVALSSCRAQPSPDAAGIDEPRGALLLGYSGCSDAMIWEGAKRLGRAVASVAVTHG